MSNRGKYRDTPACEQFRTLMDALPLPKPAHAWLAGYWGVSESQIDKKRNGHVEVNRRDLDALQELTRLYQNDAGPFDPTR